ILIDRRVVVVRTDRQREPPVRHRRRGIELRRASEEAEGFDLVVALQQEEALIEELLRLRVLRGDRVRVGPQARGQELGRSLRRYPPVLVLSEHRRADREKQKSKKWGQVYFPTQVSFTRPFGVRRAAAISARGCSFTFTSIPSFSSVPLTSFAFGCAISRLLSSHPRGESCDGCRESAAHSMKNGI